ncbi:TPA: glycosyltransferase [Escherichia coli]|uniref:glycosyltransferase n=1 Tax=Escherichia coli TaxID=562 RepID=UPI000DA4B467|nr:glycosyltransferase [Escherichia coli]EIA8213326.1 glycosyltransferase [Escherichia coli]EJA1145653.1 glycosyltransferase [Escherichia coli]MCZ5653085.1 glycosyltransferase [Escherichia coli]SQT64824.1 putative glucosyl-3-phosphoglycerate synthase [Escherichia coli]HBA3741743.1 glycosyltransferase [Escherichia coli]
MHYRGQHVALIVPCYNEESAIESVVYGFREALPEIDIYVFDNNSSDRTAQVAEAAGAKVISVKLPGKGNVVRRMFADVDADIYVMVDGDATYEAGAVKSLVDKLLDNHLDMVVGCRKTKEEIAGEAYRRGHQWGNYMLTHSVVKIFGGNFTDMLSGYRAFTRRYVKSFPAISRGFEIETELTVHALELRMPYGEVMTEYGARPEGSVSKLSTYRDGFRILKMIARLYITERPFAFFGICALLMALTSVILGFPLLTEYLETGLVPRFPTAVLAASIMIAAALSFVCGLILDNVTRGRHEMKRLVYLGIPLPFMGSNK